MSFDKVRIRFRKDGDLRFVSHHDLMRAFERMLRRASLPFRSTEGFHPQPRLIFALSLPLGVSGLAEVLEIEWTESIEPDAALSRLERTIASGNRLPFRQANRHQTNRSRAPRDLSPECSHLRNRKPARPLCENHGIRRIMDGPGASASSASQHSTLCEIANVRFGPPDN